jgi:hypothetical protein
MINYARLLELNKFKINENLIEEADSTSNLDKIKSGINGGTYAATWKALTDIISDKVDKNIKNGKVLVKLPDGISVEVNWKFNDKGQIQLSVKGGKGAAYTDAELKPNVDRLVDDLDGLVLLDDLKSIYNILIKYDGSLALADDDTTEINAIPRILELYARDEPGSTLLGDVNSVGTATLAVEAEKYKTKIATLINKYKGQAGK